MARGDPFDTQGFGAGDTFTSATLASGSSTPTIRSRDVKGGLMEVVDIAARDAVPGAALAKDHPDQFRQEGMLCYVQADGKTYQLRSGIANANWIEFAAGTAGGIGYPVVNNTGSQIDLGAVLARSSTVGVSTTADVVECDADDIDLNAANVFGVAIADLASGGGTGTAMLVGPIPVLFKGGLSLTPGDAVLMSETTGRATNEKPPLVPTGGSVVKIGTLIHPLTYDGAADLLALVLFLPGQRREKE